MKVVDMGFLIQSVMTALLAAFLILFMGKVGLRERLQVRGNKWISEMANCDFCFSFWVCMVIAVFGAIFTGDYKLLFVAVFAAPLTRALI